jgi:precorrin-6A synthase
MRRRLLLIGVGTGDPDHVTVAAVRALDAFDVLFLVTKDGIDDLVDHRMEIVRRHRTTGPYRTVELADPPRPWRTAPDYRDAVTRWRRARALTWRAGISDGLAEGETGAFLVWGDPSVYESTLAVITALVRGGLQVDYEVIPGISSIHALTARHRIPLNRVGAAVQIMPARLLAKGFPDGVDDVVVMLDAGGSLTQIAPAGVEIYWGAYLGTEDEILISGPLGDVAERIVRAREAARTRRGWIFDIYLLRRVGSRSAS